MSLPAPILVCGAPFSGTSLLAQLLGGHPGLYATPELRLGMADDLGGLLEVFRFAQLPLDEGLLRLRAQWASGRQDDAGIAAARDWLAAQAGRDTADLIAELAAAAAPRRLVIPDSEAALRPAELLRWQRWVPGLQVIQCLRHPLTHGAVWAPWLEARLFVPLDARDNVATPAPGAIEPQIAWLRALGNVERWVPADRRYRLRMETLDTAPEAALLELFAFLGLDVAGLSLTRLLALTDSDFAGPGPGTAPGGLEAEVLEPVLEGVDLPPPRLDGLTPWSQPPRLLAPEVVAAAQVLGYE